MMTLFDLRGKRALITGGTHGLGMAMAKGIGQAGATLLINGHSPDKMEGALKTYHDLSLKAEGHLFDVTDDRATQKAVDKIEESGPIDILINNAGIIKRTPILDMDVADFRQVIDVDLVGPFIVSRAVGKHMIRRQDDGVIRTTSRARQYFFRRLPAISSTVR